MTAVFISGIDTDIGKSVAVGMMARFLKYKGESVITQKIVQTGCENMAEDILLHRKLMGCDLFFQDKNKLTCPYLFKHPASPHLAASLENTVIDPQLISTACRQLENAFDIVLVEGAGGLQVPLSDSFTVLDYIEKKQYPVILVTAARLGTINHTFLSIDALKMKKLELKGVIYNRHFATDPLITDDTAKMISGHIRASGFDCSIVAMDRINPTAPENIDFSKFFD